MMAQDRHGATSLIKFTHLGLHTATSWEGKETWHLDTTPVHTGLKPVAYSHVISHRNIKAELELAHSLIHH